MSVALKKLEGAETVRVSLNKGTATVELKPGNPVTLDQVRQHVKTHGFTPKDARVTVQGELAREGAGFVLKVSGTDVKFAVNPGEQHPQASAALEEHIGKSVAIEGTVPEPKEKAADILLAENVQGVKSQD